MKLEREIQKEIMTYLKRKDIFCIKISERFSSGIPDLHIINNGRHYWLELKTEKGKVSDLQKITLAKINAAGGDARVVRSLDDVIKVLREGLK